MKKKTTCKFNKLNRNKSRNCKRCAHRSVSLRFAQTKAANNVTTDVKLISRRHVWDNSTVTFFVFWCAYSDFTSCSVAIFYTFFKGMHCSSVVFISIVNKINWLTYGQKLKKRSDAKKFKVVKDLLRGSKFELMKFGAAHLFPVRNISL